MIFFLKLVKHESRPTADCIGQLNNAVNLSRKVHTPQLKVHTHLTCLNHANMSNVTKLTKKQNVKMIFVKFLACHWFLQL